MLYISSVLLAVSGPSITCSMSDTADCVGIAYTVAKITDWEIVSWVALYDPIISEMYSQLIQLMQN